MRFNAWRLTYFPERQLFLRSEGRVRFLTIHSYVQMAIASALLFALIWGVITSYAYLTRDILLESKNKTISTMSNQYKTLSNDFSALEAEVERRAVLLEERQRFLEDMLSADVPAAEPVDTENGNGLPNDAISPAEEEEASLLSRIFAGPEAQATQPTNIDRRTALLGRLQNIEASQRHLVNGLADDIDAQLSRIETTLEPTELTVADLIPAQQENIGAVGGPFIPEQSFGDVFQANDGDAFTTLIEKQSRLKMVTNALDSFPVGKPTEKYYISDRFGSRRDPFTKVRSQHYGLDMAGWPGSAIEATSAGRVIYAGWYGPYGNMVEVDHGNGFRTRYGHMRKLSVKKNEQVELGQKLGEMGKTGRATGTHLHYEVWFNDKVRDPMPFIKAAENVLKIQGRYEETNE